MQRENRIILYSLKEHWSEGGMLLLMGGGCLSVQRREMTVMICSLGCMCPVWVTQGAVPTKEPVVRERAERPSLHTRVSHVFTSDARLACHFPSAHQPYFETKCQERILLSSFIFSSQIAFYRVPFYVHF